MGKLKVFGLNFGKDFADYTAKWAKSKKPDPIELPYQQQWVNEQTDLLVPQGSCFTPRHSPTKPQEYTMPYFISPINHADSTCTFGDAKAINMKPCSWGTERIRQTITAAGLQVPRFVAIPAHAEEEDESDEVNEQLDEEDAEGAEDAADELTNSVVDAELAGDNGDNELNMSAFFEVVEEEDEDQHEEEEEEEQQQQQLQQQEDQQQDQQENEQESDAAAADAEDATEDPERKKKSLLLESH